MMQMVRGKNIIPVMATWKFIAPNGDTGIVWLDERHENLEIWRWRYEGQPHRRDPIHARNTDWAPTKRSAVQQCGDCFGSFTDFSIRFKRVKNT